MDKIIKQIVEVSKQLSEDIRYDKADVSMRIEHLEKLIEALKLIKFENDLSFGLEDFENKVNQQLDLIDDEYQNSNPVVRDTLWGYHNRLRMIMITVKQELLRNK